MEGEDGRGSDDSRERDGSGEDNERETGDRADGVEKKKNSTRSLLLNTVEQYCNICSYQLDIQIKHLAPWSKDWFQINTLRRGP